MKCPMVCFRCPLQYAWAGAGPVAALLPRFDGLLDQAVRVEHVLARRAMVEFGVPLRCLVQRDDRGVHVLRDLRTVVQDRLHQLPVVPHDGALPGREPQRLGPAQAQPDRQRTGLRGLVTRAGIAGHVEAWDADRATGAGDVHDRVQYGRRTFGPGVRAVAVRLEPDRVDGRVDLRFTEDLRDLVPRLALGHVDRLAAEAARLLEPFLLQIGDDHDRRAEQERRCRRGEADRSGAGDVDGRTGSDAG